MARIRASVRPGSTKVAISRVGRSRTPLSPHQAPEARVNSTAGCWQGMTYPTTRARPGSHPGTDSFPPWTMKPPGPASSRMRSAAWALRSGGSPAARADAPRRQRDRGGTCLGTGRRSAPVDLRPRRGRKGGPGEEQGDEGAAHAMPGAARFPGPAEAPRPEEPPRGRVIPRRGCTSLRSTGGRAPPPAGRAPARRWRCPARCSWRARAGAGAGRRSRRP